MRALGFQPIFIVMNATMTEQTQTLLPSGFQDLIAPQAGQAHQLLVDIIAVFSDFGYPLFEPPLLEYEESLIAAPDALKSQEIFRFIDPLSHRTIGLRGDITPQIVRIAQDHLADQPRPLRLAYYGHVLRIATTALRPQRQFMQLGLEQIGGGIQAEIEVIQVTLEALNRVGLAEVCLDFTLPMLVRNLLDEITAECAKMVAARNIGSIRQQIRKGAIEKSLGALLEFLLLLPPNPESALEQLSNNPAFADHQEIFDRLSTMIHALSLSHPKAQLSLDVIEQYSFDHKTGIGYNLYAKGQNTSLGRGGHYQAGEENACGFSLNLSNLLGKIENNPSTKKVSIPYNADFETIRELQQSGWVTLFCHKPETSKEANHYYMDGQIFSKKHVK